MDVGKLFSDLESNNTHDVDEAKKKLTELFSQTKDTWVVHGMLDYFYQTNSHRIIDVLVKAQQPHDKIIFDRLYEWIRSPNKTVALTVLGHIIRKHPTWLYKVANHTLMKEVLKLLKTEKEIIPLMSALLCIIILLPIIPLYMGNYVQDLFEIFSYLASWNCNNNPTNLPDDQLIHLQFGLYSLFHRLYGMFPCNFIQFLKQEYILRDKTAIFQHTIKPLLETVKIHPLLVTADKDSEIHAMRWKKKEPHDVVNECAKLSLDYIQLQQQSEPSAAECPCYMTPMKPIEYSANLLEIQLKNKDFMSLASDQKFMSFGAQQNSYWTPSNVVQPTPPPTATPTQILMPPATPNYNIPSLSGLPQLMAEGSSPPEAAVEATPETTPMKDPILKPLRPYPITSQAARAIWNTSQPSSPIKKDSNVGSQFSFETRAASQKLLRIVSDRNQLINSGPLEQYSSISSPQFDSLVMPTFRNLEITANTQEDQEVNDINSQHQENDEPPPTPQTPSAYHPQLTKEFSVEAPDFEQEEGSPCSAGGLHIKNSQSMIDFARRVSRFRLYSHCIGDTNSSFSAGTSPRDGFQIRLGTTSSSNIKPATLKYRRSSSWPDLSSNKSATRLPYTPMTAETTTSESIMKTQTNKTLENGSTSSSPSDEEAISAVTHFKKKEMKNAASMNINKLLFQQIQRNLNVDKVSTSTQTMEVWPQPYEHMLYGLLQEKIENKKLEEASKQQEMAMKPSVRFTPNEMLDEYIENCIKNKPSNDHRKTEDIYRDNIRLLYLQLQYEKYRREIHAERNRRLLGKSRAIRALEHNNEALKDQVSRLTGEISTLNMQLIQCRKKLSSEYQGIENDCQHWKLKYQEEANDNKQLKATIDTLQLRLDDELKNKKEMNLALESARGELFDLRNEMQQATYKAEIGQQYRDELNKLQAEMILMGEIQLKCKEKLTDLANMRARDVEFAHIQESYAEEVKELKSALELKSSQLETKKARLAELESVVARREAQFTDQKRLLKTVKEEYQEKFNALEKKYTAQKAIVLRMEEHILELYKNQTAVNAPTLSPESDRADHTSQLSLSLASSDLSASLRSVEIKNLQSLVVPTGSGTTVNDIVTMNNGSHQIPIAGSSRQGHMDDLSYNRQ